MSVKIDAWTRRLRLLQLLLHRGRIATRRVAMALDIDRRTALEDLKSLESHGVPLSPQGEGREREWVLEESWRKIGLRVGFDERLSLLFGRELVDSFLRETDLGEAITRFDQQIEAMSNEGERPEQELGRRFIYVREPEKDYASHRALIRDLVEAIVGGYRVSFCYKHARPPKSTTRYDSAAPLTFAIYKRGLYMICERRGERTLHAVERMSDLTSHPNRTFDYPIASDYDPRGLLGKRVGLADDGREPEQIRLRFHPAVRQYAERRRWMPDQEVIPLDDGGCEIRFAAHGRELVSRVLEYGDKVEALAPQWLRDAVLEELRGALKNYERDS